MVYPRCKNKNGSVLIVSLWILAIFVVFLMSLSRLASFDAKMSMREQENFIAESLISSGIDLAKYYLESDKEPSVDSRNDEWYNSSESLMSIWDVKGLSINIRDIESKLNLNYVDSKIMNLLLASISDKIELYSDIDDFIESYDEYVAEVFSNRGTSKFTSLKELLLIEGFDSRDFNLLSNYLCVNPAENKLMININTASKEVLRTVIYSLAGNEAHKEKLYERLLEYLYDNESEEQYFDAEKLSPYEMLETIGLTSDVTSVSLALQFLKMCTVDSKSFEVLVEVKGGELATSKLVSAVLVPVKEDQVGSVASAGYSIIEWSQN